MPLCRYHRSRPFQVRKRTLGPPAPTASRVPSSWFLTTSTVCSSYGFAGLLRPATSLRFVAFPAPLPVSAETVTQASRAPSQATCFTPFRVFPSSVAVPRHHLSQGPKSQEPMFTNGRCLHDIPTSPTASTCSRRNAHWLLLQLTGLAPAGLRVTAPQPRCQVWFAAPFRPGRPSSRPCSTDESVASRRHCWQHLARYSHGLCSPSRSSRTLRSGLASATAALQTLPPLARLPPQQLAPPSRTSSPARPRAYLHLRSLRPGIPNPLVSTGLSPVPTPQPGLWNRNRIALPARSRLTPKSEPRLALRSTRILITIRLSDSYRRQC